MRSEVAVEGQPCCWNPSSSRSSTAARCPSCRVPSSNGLLPVKTLDTLFRQQAQRQYTREVLFSSVVDLLSLVVCGKHPTIHAAYRAQRERLPVSLTSVYDKLAGIETDVSAELVRHTSRQLQPLLRELHAALPEPVPGYHLRILEGNKLAGTQHRLPETRDDAAAPLPGQTLA